MNSKTTKKNSFSVVLLNILWVLFLAACLVSIVVGITLKNKYDDSEIRTDYGEVIDKHIEDHDVDEGPDYYLKILLPSGDKKSFSVTQSKYYKYSTGDKVKVFTVDDIKYFVYNDSLIEYYSDAATFYGLAALTGTIAFIILICWAIVKSKKKVKLYRENVLMPAIKNDYPNARYLDRSDIHNMLSECKLTKAFSDSISVYLGDNGYINQYVHSSYSDSERTFTYTNSIFTHFMNHSIQGEIVILKMVVKENKNVRNYLISNYVSKSEIAKVGSKVNIDSTGSPIDPRISVYASDKYTAEMILTNDVLNCLYEYSSIESFEIVIKENRVSYVIHGGNNILLANENALSQNWYTETEHINKILQTIADRLKYV